MIGLIVFGFKALAVIAILYIGYWALYILFCLLAIEVAKLWDVLSK